MRYPEDIPGPSLAGQDLGSMTGKPGGNACETDPSEQDSGRWRVLQGTPRNSQVPGEGEPKTYFAASSFTWTCLKLPDILGLVAGLLLLNVG